MTVPFYIYVHGFNSSPASMKAQLFRRYMQQSGLADRFQVPELSHWPQQAMATLVQLVEAHADSPVILLGSSLGGYYSIWLTEHYSHVKTVLINPAIKPYELLPQYLGLNENLYSGESYELTEQHLQQLLDLRCDQISDPSCYLLMVQSGDETLDYRQALTAFPNSQLLLQEGGSHGFEQFETVMPLITKFATGRLTEVDLSKVESLQ